MSFGLWMVFFNFCIKTCYDRCDIKVKINIFSFTNVLNSLLNIFILRIENKNQITKFLTNIIKVVFLA